jgi:hypothetical protein
MPPCRHFGIDPHQRPTAAILYAPPRSAFFVSTANREAWVTVVMNRPLAAPPISTERLRSCCNGHQRARQSLLVCPKGFTSIAGRRAIQPRRSSIRTSVRRPRFTARSSPVLIAWYSVVRLVHVTAQACVMVQAKGVFILISPNHTGTVPATVLAFWRAMAKECEKRSSRNSRHEKTPGGFVSDMTLTTANLRLFGRLRKNGATILVLSGKFSVRRFRPASWRTHSL